MILFIKNKKMKNIILYLLIALIYCKSTDQLMRDFVKCAKKQIGKKYFEDVDYRGPSQFCNSGLIWYCRSVAGFPPLKTIYISWKRVKEPKVGAFVEGILKDNGSSVSGDNLGIIVSLKPTVVIGGDPIKGVITRHVLKPKKNYLRLEYIYIDF